MLDLLKESRCKNQRTDYFSALGAQSPGSRRLLGRKGDYFVCVTLIVNDIDADEIAVGAGRACNCGCNRRGI